VDVVLATKQEAREFTDFFKNIINGSANIFYYKNNFNGQESYVRFIGNTLQMGEAEGAPYSFSLLLRKEDPPVNASVNLRWNVIQTISTVSLVSGASGSYSIILFPTNSKTLWGSGENGRGQLGDGTTLDKVRFEQSGVDTDWESGSGGELHTLLLKDDGTLFVSGANSYGQLGLGDVTDRITFVQLGIDNWNKVAGGRNSSYGIKSDGTLWAWGQNNQGQLGQGTFDMDPHNAPLQIGSDTDWVDVESGNDFIVAKKLDGSLWGCGWDAFGQLGQGSATTRRTTLVKIGTDVDWGMFRCGNSHVLALKNDASLYAWGSNSGGELGNGGTTPVYTPLKIGVASWKYIAAGGGGIGFSIAIDANGRLWSWGYNGNYELGIGSADPNPHSTPTQIDSDTNWSHIASGWGHTIGVKGNEIWGWGWNGRGEVGTGFDPVTIPTKTFLPSNSVSLLWVIETGGPPPPPPP
jgi:alpha-tubulin suppressor-like RCC1 family protein